VEARTSHSGADWADRRCHHPISLKTRGKGPGSKKRGADGINDQPKRKMAAEGSPRPRAPCKVRRIRAFRAIRAAESAAALLHHGPLSAEKVHEGQCCDRKRRGGTYAPRGITSGTQRTRPRPRDRHCLELPTHDGREFHFPPVRGGVGGRDSFIRPPSRRRGSGRAWKRKWPPTQNDNNKASRLKTKNGVISIW